MSDGQSLKVTASLLVFHPQRKEDRSAESLVGFLHLYAGRYNVLPDPYINLSRLSSQSWSVNCDLSIFPPMAVYGKYSGDEHFLLLAGSGHSQ